MGAAAAGAPVQRLPEHSPPPARRVRDRGPAPAASAHPVPPATADGRLLYQERAYGGSRPPTLNPGVASPAQGRPTKLAPVPGLAVVGLGPSARQPPPYSAPRSAPTPVAPRAARIQPTLPHWVPTPQSRARRCGARQGVSAPVASCRCTSARASGTAGARAVAPGCSTSPTSPRASATPKRAGQQRAPLRLLRRYAPLQSPPRLAQRGP